MTIHSKPTRRQVLSNGLALSALGSQLVLPSQAFSAASFKKSQAPGFFRFSLGKFEVTILTDGMNATPLRFSASNVPEAELKAFLSAHHLSTETRLSHLNVCLINTGERLILVDAGSGDNFTETAGQLSTSLESAGYAPGDVDAVIITHGHPDHIWGIVDDFEEEPRFANAEYFIDSTEWDYWTAADLETRLPEGFKFFSTGARRNLLPIADRTTRLVTATEIMPGVSTLATRGHTLGHMSVVVHSEGESLVVVGDAITHPFISLEHPEWQPQMDMEKEDAVETRKRLLDMAASDRMLVSSYHMPFPGVGHIARIGNTYRWIPLTWHWNL